MPPSSDYEPFHEHARLGFQELQARTRVTLTRIQSYAESLKRFCAFEKRSVRDEMKVVESMCGEATDAVVEDSKLDTNFCDVLMAMVMRRSEQSDKFMSSMVEPWEHLVKVSLRRHRECVAAEQKEARAALSLSQSVARRRAECVVQFDDLNEKIRRVAELDKSSKKRAKRDKEFHSSQQRCLKSFSKFEDELEMLNEQEVLVRNCRKEMSSILADALKSELDVMLFVKSEAVKNLGTFETINEKVDESLKHEPPTHDDLVSRYVAPAFAHQYGTPCLAENITAHYTADQYVMPVVVIDDEGGVRTELAGNAVQASVQLQSLDVPASDSRPSSLSRTSTARSHSSVSQVSPSPMSQNSDHSFQSDPNAMARSTSCDTRASSQISDSEESCASLPPHWIEVKDDGEHNYYWNSETEESQWRRPRRVSLKAIPVTLRYASLPRASSRSSISASAEMSNQECGDCECKRFATHPFKNSKQCTNCFHIHKMQRASSLSNRRFSSMNKLNVKEIKWGRASSNADPEDEEDEPEPASQVYRVASENSLLVENRVSAPSSAESRQSAPPTSAETRMFAIQKFAAAKTLPNAGFSAAKSSTPPPGRVSLSPSRERFMHPPLSKGRKHVRGVSKDLKIPAGLNTFLSKGPRPPRRIARN